MIHANELMLGDIITFKDSVETDETPIPVKVIALGYQHHGDENEALVQIGGDETCDIVTIDDDFVGYPLTAKILKKNGWKTEFDKRAYMVKYDLAVEGKNCWMMWAIKEHNLDIQRQDEKLNVYNLKVQRVCIPCDYVHQLQHALRLCGIEKEIKL